MAELGVKTVVHLVGSVPLSDSETVFKTLSSGVGRFFSRLPDGETGIRKSWIRFLQVCWRSTWQSKSRMTG